MSPEAYQKSQNFGFSTGGETAYVAKLNSIGTALSYSTYFGSTSGTNPGRDAGTGIALDRNGDAFVTGFTTAGAFPVTPGAFQTTIANANPGNAFVSEFDLGPENGTYYHSATTVTVVSPRPVGQTVTFTAKVASSEGRGTPTGSVVFAPTNQGYQAYGTAELNGAGEATYTTKYAKPGKYTVYATYSGDSRFTANSTGAATVTILGGPASISVVSGSGQSVVYDNPFPEPLVVIVKDSAGDPLPGQVVTFAGNALKFSSVTVTTGANGEASVTAIPTKAGSLVASATASGVSAPANFTLTATTAPGLSISSGNGQTGAYGSALAQPLTVLVTTPTGAALPNVTVSFSGAGLRLSSATAVTNAQGLASVTATVTAVGSLMATARVTGMTNTVTFSETGTKALLTVTANSATVVWGQPLPPLTYSITGFTNGDTSSVVSGAPVETTTEGSAPGSYPIAISQGTLAAADYDFIFVNGTLTAVAPNIPAAISIYSGNGQGAYVGTAFAQLLEVRVVDQFGYPAVGVPVSFVGAGLVVSGSIAYTNANGVAAVGAAALTAGDEACAAEAGKSLRVIFTEVGVWK